jgi:hypothetical protein
MVTSTSSEAAQVWSHRLRNGIKVLGDYGKWGVVSPLKAHERVGD